MTQSFNLSQLANNLTSAGLLDASDGLVNAVPIANGGTGATNATGALANLGITNFLVPSGGIIMWSGSIGMIPTGWLLCDGTNGTPDLRSRFVVGAGSSFAVGANGGSADAIVVSHTHGVTQSITDTGHRHELFNTDAPSGGTVTSSTYPAYYSPNAYYAYEILGTSTQPTIGLSSNETTGISINTTISSTGTSGTNANLPPYYSLAFIMKS